MFDVWKRWRKIRKQEGSKYRKLMEYVEGLHKQLSLNNMEGGKGIYHCYTYTESDLDYECGPLNAYDAKVFIRKLKKQVQAYDCRYQNRIDDYMKQVQAQYDRDCEVGGVLFGTKRILTDRYGGGIGFNTKN